MAHLDTFTRSVRRAETSIVAPLVAGTIIADAFDLEEYKEARTLT